MELSVLLSLSASCYYCFYSCSNILFFFIQKEYKEIQDRDKLLDEKGFLFIQGKFRQRICTKFAPLGNIMAVSQ